MGIQSSPPRRRNNNTIFSDRYIPNRTGVDLQAAFSLSHEEILPDLRRNVDNEIEVRREEEANRTFSTVLKAELFGDNVPMATANLTNSSTSSGVTTSRPKQARTIATSGTTSSSMSSTPPSSSSSSSSYPTFIELNILLPWISWLVNNRCYWKHKWSWFLINYYHHKYFE